MSPLLEKALEKVGVLPQAEQDAIASQILASLADEEAWRRRFAEKRDIIRRLAREALEEDALSPTGRKRIAQGVSLGKGMNGR
jgi:acyl-CoA reductase-like NAD-dependent aldehyde dehydrogenase